MDNYLKPNFSKRYMGVLLTSFLLCLSSGYIVFQISSSPLNLLLALTCLLLLFLCSHLSYFVYSMSKKLNNKSKKLNNSSDIALFNKQAMIVLAQTMINLHGRLGQNLCFLIVDVDGFKETIDQQDPILGETALMRVSVTFKSNLRETDIVSRFSDSEFLIMLPNTGTSEGYRLAEGIREQLQNQSGDSPKTTISVGCVALRKNESFIQVTKRAKEALVCAIYGGRNRTVVA